MNILILNGSPRPNGNTAAMVKAYAEGAVEAGHTVHVVDVCKKKISGCLACEYCHTKGNGRCVQQDDMQEVYPLLEDAEMIVLASPIYYHNFSGQLQCAINVRSVIGTFVNVALLSVMFSIAEGTLRCIHFTILSLKMFFILDFSLYEPIHQLRKF